MVRPRTLAVTFLLSLMAGASCARRQPLTGPGGLNAISEVEIRKSDADDVMELISTLRPSWLLMGDVREPGDPWEWGGPVVLINDIPPRPLFYLQFMPLEGIREIRYLTRTSAETRFRVGAPQGAILVITYSGVGSADSLRPDTGTLLHDPRSRSQQRHGSPGDSAQPIGDSL